MIGILNQIIVSIGKFIGFFLNLLPDSPFTWDFEFGTFFQFVNWLFPIPAFITIMYSYVSAVAIYYCVRIVLRWAKAAGG